MSVVLRFARGLRNIDPFNNWFDFPDVGKGRENDVVRNNLGTAAAPDGVPAKRTRRSASATGFRRPPDSENAAPCVFEFLNRVRRRDRAVWIHEDLVG